MICGRHGGRIIVGFLVCGRLKLEVGLVGWQWSQGWWWWRINVYMTIWAIESGGMRGFLGLLVEHSKTDGYRLVVSKGRGGFYEVVFRGGFSAYQN